MIHNVGKLDRIIRLSIGLVLVLLYWLKISGGAYNSYFIAGAVLMFITSMRRCCPIYAILGFGTCGVETDSDKQVVSPKKVKLK